MECTKIYNTLFSPRGGRVSEIGMVVGSGFSSIGHAPRGACELKLLVLEFSLFHNLVTPREGRVS